MRAYRITTVNSDYPYLVIADGIVSAIDLFVDKNNMCELDITSVTPLNEYCSNHIIVHESRQK
jgi:hypothetical protein